MIDDSDPESDYLNRASADGFKCITDDLLTVSTLAENYSHGNDKDYHHGFSSASFATNLDRETSAVIQNSLDRGRTNLKDAVKQTKLMTGSHSDSWIIQTIPPSIVHTVPEHIAQKTSDVTEFSEPLELTNYSGAMIPKRPANATGQDSCLSDAVPPKKIVGSYTSTYNQKQIAAGTSLEILHN